MAPNDTIITDEARRKRLGIPPVEDLIKPKIPKAWDFEPMFSPQLITGPTSPMTTADPSLIPGSAPATSLSIADIKPKETAQASGKPSPGSGATKLSSLGPGTGINNFSIVGPETPLAPRVIPTQRDSSGRVIGAQINPWNDTLNADLQRQRQAGTFNAVPGGSISQFSMSPEQQTEVAARKEANTAALNEADRNLTYLNMRQGAHGPAQARQIERQIAGMEAARAKNSINPWDVAKTQSEIQANQSRAKLYDQQAQAKSMDPIDVAANNAMIEARKQYLDKNPGDFDGANTAMNSARDAVYQATRGKKWRPQAVKKGGWFEKDTIVPGSWESSDSLASVVDPNDPQVQTARSAGYTDEEIMAYLKGRG
jgi:hypothetical protein